MSWETTENAEATCAGDFTDAGTAVRMGRSGSETNGLIPYEQGIARDGLPRRTHCHVTPASLSCAVIWRTTMP